MNSATMSDLPPIEAWCRAESPSWSVRSACAGSPSVSRNCTTGSRPANAATCVDTNIPEIIRARILRDLRAGYHESVDAAVVEGAELFRGEGLGQDLHHLEVAVGRGEVQRRVPGDGVL